MYIYIYIYYIDVVTSCVLTASVPTHMVYTFGSPKWVARVRWMSAGFLDDQKNGR